MAKITFGITTNLSWLVIIAKEKNLFHERGVDIDFRVFISGKKCLAALRKGWIDIANVIEVNVASLAFEKKPKIKLICNTQIKRDDGIIAHKKSGIENANDLRGKSIGYMPKTSSHVFLMKFFEYHGIDIAEANLITMTPEGMRREFFNYKIDAFSIWEPFNTQERLLAAQNAIDITYFPNHGISSFHVALAISDKALKKDEKTIDKIIAVLKEAQIFAEEHKAETIGILSRQLGLPSAVLDQIYDKISLGIIEIDQNFWRNVGIYARWLRPDASAQYEKFIDSITRS